jgi:heat shock protein HslJ
MPMKNLSKLEIFIVAIATLGFVGKSGAATHDHVKRVFYNVTWVLTQIGSSPVTKNPPELSFDPAKGLVSGSTGVNRLHAHFTLTGQQLAFGQIAVTRRMGTQEEMSVEARFLHQLEFVNRWRINQDDLELLREGLTLLKFARRPALPEG